MANGARSTAAWQPATFDHSKTGFPLTGAHATVACSQCHVNGKYAGTSATCSSCHLANFQQTTNPNHVSVGFPTDCASCHNPHGSANDKLLHETSTNETCYGCHAEKRGPFLWEHAPVANSCVTCHDPHGSNNPRMLQAKTPFLCQRCHVTSRHPPTVYDGFALRNSTSSNRLTGEGCVVCHVTIHGSNSPSGKYFHR